MQTNLTGTHGPLVFLVQTFDLDMMVCYATPKENSVFINRAAYPGPEPWPSQRKYIAKREKPMITEACPYHVLSGKIVCTRCGNNCLLTIGEDGTVLSNCEDENMRRCFPIVSWERIAEAVCEKSKITDLYLDFLYSVIDAIYITGNGLAVRMRPIIGETRSELLHRQDYWLVQHSLRGDQIAKEKLVLMHAYRLRRHLHDLAGKVHVQQCDLDDVEQRVWLNVFLYLRTYDSKYRFWTWLKRIATNEFYKRDSYQKKVCPSEKTVEIRSNAKQTQRLSNIDIWVSWEYVRSLLSVLTVRERKVVVDYVFEKKNQRILSEELNMCVKKVRELFRNAMDKLREEVQREIP